MGPLDNPQASKAATEAGIAKSDKAAKEQWRQFADSVLMDLAATQLILTSLDYRNKVATMKLYGRPVLETPNLSALGARFKQLAKLGIIEATDQTIPSDIPEMHRKNCRIWLSRVYEG